MTTADKVWNRAVKLIRWLLILPASIASWFAALALGALLYTGLNALCPSSEMVSGLCIAPWYPVAFETLVCFGAGFAAVLILSSNALLAPSHKREIAITTFAVGAIVAGIMGFRTQAYGALACSVVVGALTLARILRRLPPLSPPNKSLERSRGR